MVDGGWSMVDGGREVLWRVDKVTDVLYTGEEGWGVSYRGGCIVDD